MAFLSKGERAWLRTRLTASGEEPSKSNESYIKRQIRAKVREAKEDLPLIFEHPEFAGMEDEFVAALLTESPPKSGKGKKSNKALPKDGWPKE